jgi:hypothetical protein
MKLVKGPLGSPHVPLHDTDALSVRQSAIFSATPKVLNPLDIHPLTRSGLGGRKEGSTTGHTICAEEDLPIDSMQTLIHANMFRVHLVL